MRRTRALVTAVALALLLVTTGCEDDVEVKPQDFVSVDADGYGAARTAVQQMTDDAVGSASDRAGGESVQQGESVGSTICKEYVDRRFRYLEQKGSFVVPRSDRDTVVQRVREAWAAKDWKPVVGGQEVAGHDDEVTAKQRSGSVDLTARAIVLENPDGGAVVNVEVRTGCLELSKEALAADDSSPTR